MGLYDFMYLVTKEQFHSSKGGYSNVDGVGGDVRESQVNNIEVTHGGTVLIHDKTDSPSGRINDIASNEGDGKVKSDGNYEIKEGYRRSNGSEGRGGGGGPSSFAAFSEKLSRGSRRLPNAIIPKNNGKQDFIKEAGGEEVEEWMGEPMDVDEPTEFVKDLRRQTLDKEYKRQKRVRDEGEKSLKVVKGTSNGRRGASAIMNELVETRLKELQGGKSQKKKGPPKTGLPPRVLPAQMSDADKNRKIVHELRDVYKSALKRKAAGIGFRQGVEDMEELPLERGKKRKFSFEEEEGDGGVKNPEFKRRRVRETEEFLSPLVQSEHVPTIGKKKGKAKNVAPVASGWKRVATLHVPVKKRGREEDEVGGQEKRRELTSSTPRTILTAKKRHLPIEEESSSRRKFKDYHIVPLAGKKRGSADEEIFKGKKGRTRSPPPVSIRKKRKLLDDDFEDYRGGKRLKRGPSPPLKAEKRKREEEEEEALVEEELNELETLIYPPSFKRKRRARYAVPPILTPRSSYKLGKRKYNDWDGVEEEEEETGIPFKSKLVTFDDV